MINPLLPRLQDAGDTLEVDKAIIDIARQHNIDSASATATLNAALAAMSVTIAAAVAAAASGPLLMSCLEGCALSNAADAAHDITITKGRRRDSLNTVNMVLAAAITKQIDAAWAVGTNAGGMDTGAVGATSTYYVYLISSADGVTLVDGLFSLSATAPTMPAGYTLFRMIGALRTDAAANILPGTWSEGNRRFELMAMLAGAAVTTDDIRRLFTLAAPALSRVTLYLYISAVAGQAYGWIGPTSKTDITSAAPNVMVATYLGVNSGKHEIYADGSSQIAYRITQITAAATVTIQVYGWWLPLGAYDYP